MAAAARQQKRLTKREKRRLKQEGILTVDNRLSSMFQMHNIKPMTETQRIAFESWDRGSHLMLHGIAGTGKAQPLDSKILTPSGWKLMSDIHVGDSIVSPDGSFSKVNGVYPQGFLQTVKVTFDDGSSTRCCENHLWSVWYCDNAGKSSTNKVIDTRRMIEIIEQGTNVYVDLIDPHLSEPITLPLDPYLLGVLISDGGLTKSVTFTTADQFVVDQVRMAMPSECSLSEQTGCPITYRIVSNRGVSNPVLDAVRDMKLFGKKSQDKFIPDVYMNSSAQQRWDLLQGLMDGDGTVGINARGGRALTFHTTSNELSQQVQQLVWSLGGRCNITTNTTRGYRKNDGAFVKGLINFTLHINHRTPKKMFRLPRKKDLALESYNNGQTTLRRRVERIEYGTQEYCQCISVDSDDHLYVTDDYVVTHNTFLGMNFALKAVQDDQTPYNKVFIVRSTVPTRDQGFLPGSQRQKEAVYEEVYVEAARELYGRGDAYDILKQKAIVEFKSTSFLRGTTFRDCIILVDEVQNMSDGELHTVMTRVGENSRIIFCGDVKQDDLTSERKREVSGLANFMRVIRNMPEFDFVEFTASDIVRSALVKSYIIERDKLGL